MTDAPAPQLPLPVEEWDLRGHLFIHHLVYVRNVPDGDLAQLVECHEGEHDGNPAPRRPHTHTAPLIEEEEEWSWG